MKPVNQNQEGMGESSWPTTPRWRPEGKQLRILEKTFQSLGGSIPSDEHIYLIAARLRKYGEVEPRSIRLWFHNRKRAIRRMDGTITPAFDGPVSATPSNPPSTSVTTSSAPLVPFVPAMVDLSTSVTSLTDYRGTIVVPSVNIHDQIGLLQHMQRVYDAICHVYWNHPSFRAPHVRQDLVLRDPSFTPRQTDDRTLPLFPVNAGNVVTTHHQTGSNDANVASTPSTANVDLRLRLGPHLAR